MKPRGHDPCRLDVAALGAEGGELSGAWPGHTLARLADSQTLPQDSPPLAVDWQVRGERRAVTGGDPELWLHLEAGTSVWLECQRCLQPFQQPLAVQRRLRFVRDEAQAEALDAESEDDVLALPRWLDLRELIEDELLLSLPLIPRHEQCPQPLPQAGADLVPHEAEERPHPFAVLQGFKTRR